MSDDLNKLLKILKQKILLQWIQGYGFIILYVTIAYFLDDDKAKPQHTNLTILITLFVLIILVVIFSLMLSKFFFSINRIKKRLKNIDRKVLDYLSNNKKTSKIFNKLDTNERKTAIIRRRFFI